MYKVIVAGGRDFNNYEMMRNKLDFYLSNKVESGEEIVIISGTANGADKLGERYAKEKGYRIEHYPADWDKFKKSAGYIRNKQMAEVANACICFWDQKSRGTSHMITLAENQGLPLRVVNY